MRKKILLLALAVMIGLTALADPLFVAAKKAAVTPANPVKKGDELEWSYVYFGSYPQTQVLKKDVTKAIRRAKYNKNGDATVDGVKYRRVSWEDMNSFSDEMDLGYWGGGKYLYFKWEPIKWRVLKNDGNTLFVVTDRVIADQWNENYSTTWEDSTIREFLNDTFYTQAFNKSERKAIVEQTVKNQKYDMGNNTIDKVYLPARAEVKLLENEEYPTEYAFATGARIEDPNHNGERAVTDRLWRTYLNDKYGYDGGIAPVLHIDIHSDQWKLVEDSDPVKMEKMQIFATEKKVGAGIDFRVHLRTYPFLAVTKGKEIEWSVSDPEYAEIKRTGKGWKNLAFYADIHAKKGGKTVTITARAADGSGVEAKIKVKIMEHKVTEVKLKNPQLAYKKYSWRIAVGQTIKLEAEVATNGENAYSDLYWESDIPSYLSVDQEGNVTALDAEKVKKPGEVPQILITARAQDGSGERASIQFITMKHKVTKVSFKDPQEKLAAGQTVKLKAKVATNGKDACTDLYWKSSNPEYATVDQEGNVTALEAGIGKTVTITAKAQDGTKKKAKHELEIVEHEVTGVSFKNPKKKLAVGKTMKLKTNVTTSGENAYTDLSWKSSNPKYATVDQKGKVTALEAGKGKTVTITAVAKDGTGKKAKVKIKIK